MIRLEQKQYSDFGAEIVGMATLKAPEETVRPFSYTPPTEVSATPSIGQGLVKIPAFQTPTPQDFKTVKENPISATFIDGHDRKVVEYGRRLEAELNQTKNKEQLSEDPIALRNAIFRYGVLLQQNEIYASEIAYLGRLIQAQLELVSKDFLNTVYKKYVGYGYWVNKLPFRPLDQYLKSSAQCVPQQSDICFDHDVKKAEYLSQKALFNKITSIYGNFFNFKEQILKSLEEFKQIVAVVAKNLGYDKTSVDELEARLEVIALKLSAIDLELIKGRDEKLESEKDNLLDEVAEIKDLIKSLKADSGSQVFLVNLHPLLNLLKAKKTVDSSSETKLYELPDEEFNKLQNEAENVYLKASAYHPIRIREKPLTLTVEQIAKNVARVIEESAKLLTPLKKTAEEQIVLRKRLEQSIEKIKLEGSNLETLAGSAFEASKKKIQDRLNLIGILILKREGQLKKAEASTAKILSALKKAQFIECFKLLAAKNARYWIGFENLHPLITVKPSNAAQASELNTAEVRVS